MLTLEIHGMHSPNLHTDIRQRLAGALYADMITIVDGCTIAKGVDGKHRRFFRVHGSAQSVRSCAADLRKRLKDLEVDFQFLACREYVLEQTPLSEPMCVVCGNWLNDWPNCRLECCPHGGH